jgi:hypothetical protein
MEGPNSMQVSLDFDQDRPIQGLDLSFQRLPKPASRLEPAAGSDVHHATNERMEGWTMGRGLLLWMIGIPLPIILVIWLFGGLS